MAVMFCPYCQKEAVFFRTSTHLYGKDYGPLWMCEDCDAYVGCHRGTSNPLGTLANKELRAWRRAAHEAFDPLWKNGKLTRKDAYQFLQNALSVTKQACHIAKFNEAQCLFVIQLAQERHRIDDLLKRLELDNSREK